jgi:predicted TIM-barrel fold metal-dependent hydrolase
LKREYRLIPEILSKFHIFDTHIHFFPEKLLTTIWQYFDRYYWPIYKKDTPENLGNFLIHENNVKNFLVINYAHKQGIARSLNDWTYKFCTTADRKAVAIPCGTIHPDDSNKSEEMSRLFEELGFAGIKLQLMVTDFHIWDKRMDIVYRKILEYNKVLIVHIGTGPSYSNYNLGQTINCPYVGVKHLLRFMTNYPDMKVIVPHLGAAEYEEMWSLIEKFPNIYFDTAMIGVKNNPAFNDGLDSFKNEQIYELSDRILFGSDFPNIPYKYENSIQGWLQREMEPSFYEKLFFRNAELLFSNYL